MSDYSKVNLLEIESSGKPDGPQVHFSRKFLDSRDLGVTLESYPPNYQSPSAHSHEVQEEAYVVIKGSGTVLLNQEVIELKAWDVVRVAPATSRSFASGPEGMELIAIGGPKPEAGDGVKQTPEWPKK